MANVMVNDSTIFMRSSAMSDVYVVLFTFLAHFWLVVCESDPHWLFAKWLSFSLPSHACSNLSTCRMFRLTHSKCSMKGTEVPNPRRSSACDCTCVLTRNRSLSRDSLRLAMRILFCSCPCKVNSRVSDTLSQACATCLLNSFPSWFQNIWFYCSHTFHS